MNTLVNTEVHQAITPGAAPRSGGITISFLPLSDSSAGFGLQAGAPGNSGSLERARRKGFYHRVQGLGTST